METLAALSGITGLGLMIWATVFGVRRRRRWDHLVARGFWIRFTPGYAALFLALLSDPAEPDPTALLGLLELTGIGLMIWGGVIAFRCRRRGGMLTNHGAAARFGTGLGIVVVAIAITPVPGKVDPMSGRPPVTPVSEPQQPPTAPDSETQTPDLPAGVPQEAQKAMVMWATSGDTMRLAATEPGNALATTGTVDVRLLNIRVPANPCLNQDSAVHLRRLAPAGSTVWVLRDQQTQDEQGQYLLYVWNESAVFTNVDMVRSGLADSEFMPPNSLHWPEISAAGEQAKGVRADSSEQCGAAETTSSAQPSPQPKPEPKPQPQPNPVYTPPPDDDDNDSGAVYYENCSAAKEAGAAPLYRGEPGYGSHLDRDNDGVACES